MKIFYIPLSLIPYTGETGTGSEGSGAGSSEGQGGNQGKTYTETEFNSHMAKARKEWDAKIKKIQDQLTEVSTLKMGTDQEKEELAARLEQIRTESLTKEEQARVAQEKEKKKYETDIADFKKKGEYWQGLYNEMYINNELLTAATKHEAVSPTQILALLQRDAQVVPVLDDKGQTTGKYKVTIKHNDPKTQKTLDLSPDEKLKLMLEDTTSFGNLFKTTLNGGKGDSNSTKPPTEVYTGDMNAFMSRRQKTNSKG